ncbi:MAG: hypothetical protein V4482_03340 [Pseudomonadota bacterium]
MIKRHTLAVLALCFFNLLCSIDTRAETNIPSTKETKLSLKEDAQKNAKELQEEAALLYFPLKTELDSVTLQKHKTPMQTLTSIPVVMWVGTIDRLSNGVEFLSTLPENIGILINPFDTLPADVLALIAKQKRQCALVIPTRSRFDGEDQSPATLNNTKESHDYFEQVLTQTQIKTIFIPDMIDVDPEALEFIIALANKHGLTLIIPPQFFNNIQELCHHQNVTYHLLNSFVASNTTFNEFKLILSTHIETMQITGELKIAVLLTDEAKKSHFKEYIDLIKANKGLFVDGKPSIQAK